MQEEVMQHRINGTEPLPRRRRRRAGGTAEGEHRKTKAKNSL